MIANFDVLLIAQFFLLFWVPPLVFQEKTIFSSDLFNLLWFPLALSFVWKAFPKKIQKRKMAFLLSLVFIFTLSWLHGFFRPQLGQVLRENLSLNFSQTENFQFIKELVNASRFFMWAISLWLVFHLFLQNNKLEKQIGRLYSFCGITVFGYFLLCILEQLSPGFRNSYYLFYGIDPGYFDWKLRSFGLLRSPHESAAVFASAFFLYSSFLKKKFQPIVFLVAVVGIALTRSATIGVAFLISTSILFLSQYRKNKLVSFSFYFSTLLLLVLTYVFRDHPQVRVKFIDFTYRIGPWKLYLSTLFSRWDLFLFGLGYPPYHVDNSYLWVLTRLGFLGFFLLFYFFITGLKKIWSSFDLNIKALFLFIALSGLALDFWIYRPFLNTMIVLAMPLLARNWSKTLVYQK